MNSVNSALTSITIVILLVSILSIVFPSNKYRKHLFLISKIIIVTIIIGLVTSADIDLDFEFNNAQSDASVFADTVLNEIENDINEYIETVYDTECNAQIFENELVVTITRGDINSIKRSIFEKFGINCRVIKNE